VKFSSVPSAVVIAWLVACAAPAGPRSASVAAPGQGPRFEVVRRFPAVEANQAVAADAAHFYAIDNRTIAKYDKTSGKRTDRWTGPADGPILHLNSGVVLDGRLYAAHSNYPGVPMWSSIEIFDADSLEHVGSHSFGIGPGSATWIDRRDGRWWVAFAHYAGRGGESGKGPGWTELVVFDDDWRRVAGYVFPPEVLERFGRYSTSGGAWGPDGLLYVSGHDAPEVYALRVPRAGSQLELVHVLPVESEGQGIAWEPGETGALYTIRRSAREIVVSRLR
jgi:hypothetical protein